MVYSKDAYVLVPGILCQGRIALSINQTLQREQIQKHLVSDIWLFDEAAETEKYCCAELVTCYDETVIMRCLKNNYFTERVFMFYLFLLKAIKEGGESGEEYSTVTATELKRYFSGGVEDIKSRMECLKHTSFKEFSRKGEEIDFKLILDYELFDSNDSYKGRKTLLIKVYWDKNIKLACEQMVWVNLDRLRFNGLHGEDKYFYLFTQYLRASKTPIFDLEVSSIKCFFSKSIFSTEGDVKISLIKNLMDRYINKNPGELDYEIIPKRPVKITLPRVKAEIAKEQTRLKKFGGVYVIKGYSDSYKIGVTKGTLEERIKTLQTACPTKLETVHFWQTEDAFSIEKKLHRLFKHRNIKGEWFKLTNEDIEFLKSVNF